MFLGGEVNLTSEQEQHQSSFLYAKLLINFPAVRRGGGGFIGSILLSHRWETMCFIPLHSKSNLMLHAPRNSGKKSEWTRWRREMLTQIPQSLRRRRPVIGVQLRDSEQLANQLRVLIGLPRSGYGITCEVRCVRSAPQSTKSGCLFIRLPVPTKRSHLGNQRPSWGKSFKSTIKKWFAYCGLKCRAGHKEIQLISPRRVIQVVKIKWACLWTRPVWVSLEFLHYWCWLPQTSDERLN